MKRLINKLVGWLNAIAKDKYQHFAVGAVIASAALIVAVPLGPGGGGSLCWCR